MAAFLGHVECVKVLLEKGAKIDIRSNVSEESYLIDCILSYLIELDKIIILKLLL